MNTKTIDPQALPRFIDILESCLSDPEKRREYEQGLMALRFGVQIALRCEELELTPPQIEARSGVPPEALLRVQQGDLPDPLTLTRLARALGARVIVEPSGQWRLEAVAEALPELSKAA